MKKLIALSLILVSSLAFAQSSPQTVCRMRDAVDDTIRVNVTDAGADNLANTLNGQVSTSFGYFWDGAAWRRLSGTTMAADNLAAATYAPWAGVFNMVFNSVGGVWARARADTNGNAAVRIAQDASNFVDATHPIPISDDMGANTLANTIKVELSDGTNAFLDNTTYPGYFRTQDGDSIVLQDVLDTSADGISTALNAEMSYSICGLFNGATIDMARNSATKAAMVNVENHPSAYDEANGWAKTKKEEVAILAPAKETTLNIGAAATVVLAARQVLNDPNWCVYLKNADAASSFTDADIQVSPDNVLWISLTWTACDTLGIGAGCVYCVTGNAYNYIRARVTGAGGSEVDVDSFYTSNKG